MALDLAGRVTAALNWVRRAWLAGGAVSMGFGIWSMHYVGMLAFRLPVPVLYDVPTVLVSLVAAIFGSAAGLFAVSRRKFGRVEAITGSLAMGTGIVSMHYIGMAAMRLPAMCHYNPMYVGFSILIAVVASLASMVFAFDFRDETRTTWAKVASGAVMGIAIAAMHYTGMAASTFTASDMTETTLYAVSVSHLGIAGVVVVTLILLGFTLLMTVLGRQLDVQSAELQLTETRYRLLFEHFQAGVYRATLDGRILDCNEAFANIFGYSSLNECLTHNVTEHYLSPDDWRAFISELREKSTLANLEVHQRGKNGKSVWVLENATLIENKTGVPVIEGSLVDITQRKQSEEDLRQAHEDLRRAHEDLEARVRERTAELAKANEALRAEIAENARAAKEIERLRRRYKHAISCQGVRMSRA
jgi:PAS domain S-box-containing protein